MATAELVARMATRAAQAEREDREHEAALPHLVACTDTAAGRTSYSGPYPSRAAAQEAADYEAAAEAGGGGRLVFTAEPVFPPIGYHLATRSAGGEAC